jgi:hypothetical protein
VAKIRGMKPDFWTDKNIVRLSPLARLLYIGTWNYAADCGHLEDEPVELKMRILPADNCDVDILLQELADNGRIIRKDGVITVPRLAEHQHIDKRYFKACDECKPRSDHTVKAPSRAPKPAVTTPGPRSDHTVTTRGPHDDGDGDGDGDGDRTAPRTTRSKLRRQLPADFAPSEQHQALAAERGINLAAEFAKFRDYWKGEGKPKADWDATLRNWLRNARPDPRASVPPRTILRVDQLEMPPDGLSPSEYNDWLTAQREKRQA